MLCQIEVPEDDYIARSFAGRELQEVGQTDLSSARHKSAELRIISATERWGWSASFGVLGTRRKATDF